MAFLMKIQASNAWYVPNEKELRIEFDNEPSITNYMEIVTRNRGMTTSERNELRDQFLKAIEHADTLTLKGKEILKIEDIPATEKSSLDDVGYIVKRYAGAKDWDNIVNRVRSGLSMPMPIIRKEQNGNYIALGGRTRLSAAAILDLPVKILVLDDKKIFPLFLNDRRKAAEHILLLLEGKSREYADAYVKYLLGEGKEPDAKGIRGLTMIKHLAHDVVDLIRPNLRGL